MVIVVDNWWAFVLRGIVAVLFGLLAFFLPGMALLTLVFLFGIYAIADGVLSIAAAIRSRRVDRRAEDAQPWWAILILGIFSILAGVLAFVWPGLTAVALLYLIAAWALVSGVMSIVAAIRLRKQIRGEWLLALTGVLSIMLGVLLALFPGPGLLTVVIWIGAWAFVTGILQIALGIRLRTLLRRAVPSDGFPVAVPTP
jgi:uncharacterized membrane protein HdeD (DUF308 family)